MAAEQGHFDIHLADLGEIRLPFLDEPAEPDEDAHQLEHARDGPAASRR